MVPKGIDLNVKQIIHNWFADILAPLAIYLVESRETSYSKSIIFLTMLYLVLSWKIGRSKKKCSF